MPQPAFVLFLIPVFFSLWEQRKKSRSSYNWKSSYIKKKKEHRFMKNLGNYQLKQTKYLKKKECFVQILATSLLKKKKKSTLKNQLKPGKKKELVLKHQKSQKIALEHFILFPHVFRAKKLKRRHSTHLESAHSEFEIIFVKLTQGRSYYETLGKSKQQSGLGDHAFHSAALKGHPLFSCTK